MFSLFRVYFTNLYDKHRIDNESEIHDLESYAMKNKIKTSDFTIDEIDNVLYQNTEFSQHSSLNIFENKLKDLIKHDKIVFWYSGHTFKNMINDKPYYGIALNHMSESERRNILKQKAIESKSIDHLIQMSNTIIKNPDNELINDFKSTVLNILSEETIDRFLGLQKNFYSDDFTQHLDSLKINQRFMGFFDSCNSENIINLKALNTKAKIIIFSATTEDKTISDSIGSHKFFPWTNREHKCFYRTYTCVLAYLILVEDMLSLDDTFETLENKLIAKKENLNHESYDWFQDIQMNTNMNDQEKKTIRLIEFIS